MYNSSEVLVFFINKLLLHVSRFRTGKQYEVVGTSLHLGYAVPRGF